MSAQQPAVTAAVTAYGNPYATLTPARVMNLWGRQVYVDTVYWAPEYGWYMARGAYARKDGTRGRQRAHTPVSPRTIPADVADALAPLLPADAPQPGPHP